MSYIVYYQNKDGVECIRWLPRGFACTRSELTREISIACGAIGSVNYLYCDHEGQADQMRQFAIDRGFKDETSGATRRDSLTKPIQSGPYELVIAFNWGVESVVSRSHNPEEARSYEAQITRNPQIIDRIFLRDGSGNLETLWSKSWQNQKLSA